MSSKYLLGRLPRAHNKAVPLLEEITRNLAAPAPPPPSADNLSGMPQNLGIMLNDSLGDCTCAAYYHARQVWTFHTGAMDTEPDSCVKELYEKACGYDPNAPGEGPGGNEQHVLTYLHKTGAPLTGGKVDKIVGFVEITRSNHDDVKRTIVNSGVAYIGLDVPAHILPEHGNPPDVWQIAAGNEKIVGGHAVVLAGYDDKTATLISWGKRYKMTWDFFDKYVDEVYAITDKAWTESPKTKHLPLPGGMSMQMLSSSMSAL